MTEVNIPLLRKYVEWVEEQEQITENREWNQEFWFEKGLGQQDGVDFCETAYCLAGKVVWDAGWRPLFDASTLTERVTNGKSTRYVEELARELLGVPKEDAEHLFEADNTAADIRRIAEEIAGERL